MWHEISTAPFNRDLELTVAEADGPRTMAFPCRRVLGGGSKLTPINGSIGASGRKIPIFIPFADARFGSLADMCGATSKTYRLLDHLVGAVKQCWRHDEAERIRGFEVDHQLILGRRLRWQVGRLLALEDAVHIGRSKPKKNRAAHFRKIADRLLQRRNATGRWQADGSEQPAR